MSDKCCIPGCTSSKPEIHLHAFPRSEKRFQIWLKSINDPALYKLSKNAVVLRRRVCRKHFESKYIRQRPTNGTHFVLTPDAYPTLFSEEEIESGIQNQNDSGSSINLGDPKYVPDHLQDHIYCLDERLEISTPTPESPQPEQNFSDSEFPACLNATTPPIEYEFIFVSTTVPCETSTECNPSTVETRESPKRSRRKHGANIASLTPNFKKTYYKCAKLMNSRRQINFNKRLKLAKKCEQSKNFKKLTGDLKKTCSSFFWRQIKLAAKKVKRQRFTREEKIMALALLKKNPKGYKFLQKMFVLPSRRSIEKLVENMDIDAGINDSIFDVLKDQVKDWSEKKKYCSIMFDEVALEPHVNYSTADDNITGFTQMESESRHVTYASAKDYITGFTPLESYSTPTFADHALLFMLRGACDKWRHPVAFYFCEGTTSATSLRAIIRKIVAAVERAGLIPISLICDHGATNRAAIKALQYDTRRSQLLKNVECDASVQICNSTMHVIFDPPHLIKCIRNNFLNKDLLFNGNVAKWDDIVQVYRMDCELGEIRLLPHLTDEHILPDKIKKRKVSNCTKVMSQRMVATLKYTAQLSQRASAKPISKTMATTADAVHFFDQLFDSCNSGPFERQKPLRCAVKDGSSHHNFWMEALKTLSAVIFLQNGTPCVVPSLDNWKATVRSLQKIWIFLKSKGIDRLYTRNFNLDPIENLFGRIRAYNMNPSCSGFKSSFKSLFLSDVIGDHSENFNCEDDGTTPLNVNCFLEHYTKLSESTTEYSELDTNATCSAALLALQTQSNGSSLTNIVKEKVRTNAKSFTAGFVTRQILKTHKCKTCADDLITKDISSVSNWISHRERFQSRRLTYRTPMIIRHFGYLIEICNEFLNKHAHEKQLSKKIIEKYLSKHNFDWFRCDMHKKKVMHDFINLTIKIQIHNWTNGINRILKGVDIHRLPNSLPYMQQIALDKFKKRYIGRVQGKKIN